MKTLTLFTALFLCILCTGAQGAPLLHNYELNGNLDDQEFSIDFGLIRSIEKTSSRSVVVTLRDGRSFNLRGSNDVNRSNKGVFVEQQNGEVALIEWEDFVKVEFDGQ